MAYNVVVNSDELRNCATNISNKNDDMKRILTEIQTLVKSLRDNHEWVSDASATTYDKINAMTNRFESYYNAVNNYCVYLRKAAGEYEDTEQTLNSKASKFI